MQVDKNSNPTNPPAHSSGFHKIVHWAWGAAGKVKQTLLPWKDYVRYRGSYLPRPESRHNGPAYEDDRFFLNSAIQEAARVMSELGCQAQDFIVDIGCGQGRMPIGLVRQMEGAHYLGLDVSSECIDWCQRHIESRHPSYRFQHLDLINARYNPSGYPLTPGFHLPVADATADIVYLWGVVTNMEPEHLAVYAREIGRVLHPGGKLFLTANVEDGVPRVSVNPEHYAPFVCQGPLHIVRYEKTYFIDVFRAAGLELVDYAHHAAGNCQSEMYFIRRSIEAHG